jgi:uncharacterized protein YlaI
MNPEDEVKCIWCGKLYEYDWQHDEIKDVEPTYVDLGADYELAVYMCTKCNGTLAIMTFEPNGSSLLIHDGRA